MCTDTTNIGTRGDYFSRLQVSLHNHKPQTPKNTGNGEYNTEESNPTRRQASCSLAVNRKWLMETRSTGCDRVNRTLKRTGITAHLEKGCIIKPMKTQSYQPLSGNGKGTEVVVSPVGLGFKGVTRRAAGDDFISKFSSAKVAHGSACAYT